MTAKSYNNIQFLRFVAASLVMLYHYNAYDGSVTGRLKSPVLDRFGFYGVDIFFAISGAIMWITTQRLAGIGDGLQFAYRRLARIFPNYWMFLAVFCLSLTILGSQTISGSDLLRAVLLLPVPVYMLPVAWSLTLELLFYAYFVLAVWFAPVRGLVLICVAVLTFMLVVVAPSEYVALLHLPFSWTFLGGSLAAHLAERFQGRCAFAALGVGLVVLGGAVLAQQRGLILVSPEWFRTLIFGSSAVLIVYAALGLEINGRAVAPERLARTGDWSYSLYLFHWPAMYLFSSLAAGTVYQLPNTLRSIAFMIAIGGVVAIAALHSEKVELLFYHWLTRRRGVSKPNAVAARDQSRSAVE